MVYLQSFESDRSSDAPPGPTVHYKTRKIQSMHSIGLTPHYFEEAGWGAKQGPLLMGPAPLRLPMGPLPYPWSRSVIRWAMWSHSLCQPTRVFNLQNLEFHPLGWFPCWFLILRYANHCLKSIVTLKDGFIKLQHLKWNLYLQIYQLARVVSVIQVL